MPRLRRGFLTVAANSNIWASLLPEEEEEGRWREEGRQWRHKGEEEEPWWGATWGKSKWWGGGDGGRIKGGKMGLALCSGWIAVFLLLLLTSCLRAFAQRICCGPVGSKKNGSLRLVSMSSKEYFLFSTFCQFSSTWCFAALVSFHSSHWLSSAANWELMLNQVQSTNYSLILASFAIWCSVYHLQCSLLYIVSILWSSCELHNVNFTK